MPVMKYSRLAALALALACLAAAPARAAEPAEQYGPPLLAAPPRPPSPAPRRPAEANAADYDRCMALARSDPAAARTLAQGWQARAGGHPAEHCLAVALVGLKQYKDAATRLETLGQAMVRAPAPLRAEVLGQAGQAWLLAGDAERAYAAAGAALVLRPDDPDLLIDRAEAAGSAGWFDKATADLDRVLKADPARLDALIYRASAYRAQDRLDPAQADIDAALRLAPGSIPALLERGNIRRLRGDLDGARLDWQRAALLAPDSAAAVAAKTNIERLDAAGAIPLPAKPGKR
jgi:tetratricopeptide (TPR) repeat protein